MFATWYMIFNRHVPDKKKRKCGQTYTYFCLFTLTKMVAIAEAIYSKNSDKKEDVLWPLTLCTVTFGLPNSKKNSFRGNYMRKYGMCQMKKRPLNFWTKFGSSDHRIVLPLQTFCRSSANYTLQYSSQYCKAQFRLP